MERATAAPSSRPMFIVAKWSPISGTAERLLSQSVHVPEPQITKKTKTSSTKGQVY